MHVEIKEQTLYLLVDYDNLDKRIVGTNLTDIVDHLVIRAGACLKSKDVSSCRRVIIRLYGGWYENDLLTRRAEKLVGNCPASPLLFDFRNHDKQHSWVVKSELAFGLLSVPGVHLMHTYRRRQKLTGIGVADPITAGCDPLRCRILGIEELIKTNRCPDCGTPANKILWRTEQKLVDVMLATDVMTLALIPDALICIVSSDEDFWPVLFHVSCNYKRIYHMHGIPRRHLQPIYACHAKPTYVEIPQ